MISTSPLPLPVTIAVTAPHTDAVYAVACSEASLQVLRRPTRFVSYWETVARLMTEHARRQEAEITRLKVQLDAIAVASRVYDDCAGFCKSPHELPR
jgi:hypothetical protein